MVGTLRFSPLLAALAIAIPDGVPQGGTLALEVPVPPRPVTVSGVSHVVYELRAHNRTSDTLTVDRLRVIDADTRAELATFADDSLVRRVALREGAASNTERRAIAPDGNAVIYLELSLPRGSSTRSIEHRLEYRGARRDSLATSRTTVDRSSPLVLSAPLRGGPWAAIYDPSWERGHRRVFYTVGARARLPGRFAIDFIRLDDGGHYARGDEDRPSDWLGYAADVLAVADGVVAATRDGMSESATVSLNPKHAPQDAAGNFVALQVGSGRVAFYEHLKPGSVRVRPGDRVHRGDVIASLGYTGDSTGPHLHFHVADGDTPLGAEGVPFAFDAFELLGAFETLDAFGRQPWKSLDAATGARRTREMPAPKAVVRFAADR